MDKAEVLKQFFGHSTFRAGQARLIDSILEGRDVLGVMPTGGGKSLCYQIPALLLPGITLVVSPLISLMQDQVAALRESGIRAAYLNSSLTGEGFVSVLRGIRQGAFRLVYVAPERLLVPGFLELMQTQPVSLLAVDEAHCISQWGQDFRPSYLKLAAFISALPTRPVVAAFTATATGAVRQDIQRLLGLQDCAEVVTGFDRPNLYFEVRRPKNKAAEVLALVRERAGKAGIVYCATRASVEKVCDLLCQQGVAATRYHAGLPSEERQQNQNAFQYDRAAVMVATNAFGMGIDKSNISFVLHYNMPKSLEAYYQEAGRAGRDGEAADCILLYAAGDVSTAKYMIAHSEENDALTPEERAAVRDMDYRRLSAMVRYCKTDQCLRGCILDYFGQAHEDRCGNCGSCLAQCVETDITREAQMILSCVQRIRNHLGYSVGASLVVQVLRGGRSSRLLSLGLDSLSTYGLLRAHPSSRLRSYLEYLETAGYLAETPQYSTLVLTAQAGDVLFRGKQVIMPVRAETAEATVPATPELSQASADDGLLSALKATRLQLAQQEHVPAYIVFSNASLADMARRIPDTMEAFLQVSGVGAVKAQRYGETFLRAIAQFEADCGETR